MPKLLMLDKPSIGLGPKLVMTVFDTVRRINEAGVTVLLVEQNVRHALKISKRRYVLNMGKIIIEDVGSKLLENKLVKETYLGR
jgi:branched-chain amino acid transport system ATP-binding protein